MSMTIEQPAQFSMAISSFSREAKRSGLGAVTAVTGDSDDFPRQAGGYVGGGFNKQLRHAAEQLVSNALIQPMLKQMRDSPFKVAMFHGGPGEQAFDQRLDAILSDRIAHSANFAIVDAVYRSLDQGGTGAMRLKPHGLRDASSHLLNSQGGNRIDIHG